MHFRMWENGRMGKSLSWRAYFFIFVRRFVTNSYAKTRDRIVTFILALVAAGVAVWESGAWDWSKFHWKPAAVSFLVFTVPFAIYHCLRASWDIQGQVQRAVCVCRFRKV